MNERPHAGRCHFVPVRESQVIPGGVVVQCQCGKTKVRPPEKKAG